MDRSFDLAARATRPSARSGGYPSQLRRLRSSAVRSTRWVSLATLPLAQLGCLFHPWASLATSPLARLGNSLDPVGILCHLTTCVARRPVQPADIPRYLAACAARQPVQPDGRLAPPHRLHSSATRSARSKPFVPPHRLRSSATHSTLTVVCATQLLAQPGCPPNLWSLTRPMRDHSANMGPYDTCQPALTRFPT